MDSAARNDGKSAAKVAPPSGPLTKAEASKLIDERKARLGR
jgi:hypothetical protein